MAGTTVSGDVVLKVVNVSDQAVTLDVSVQGAAKSAVSATVQTLTGAPLDENSLTQPEKVAPVTTQSTVKGGAFRHTFPACSLTVVRIPGR